MLPRYIPSSNVAPRVPEPPNMIEFPEIKDAPNFAPPPGQEWVFAQPLTWPLPVWGLFLGGLCLLGLVWYLRLRRPALILPPAPPLATQVVAINLLEDLRPEAPNLTSVELAARVTEIIRTYLHRQFGILAKYRTTQEILAQRRDPTLPPPPPALRLFEDFMLTVDALNYRREGAPALTLIDEAIAAVRQSHEVSQALA